MKFKHKRTYVVVAFMIVFILSGIIAFVQTTDLSFVNDWSIAQKIFAGCLSIFFLVLFYFITYGAIAISEDCV